MQDSTNERTGVRRARRMVRACLGIVLFIGVAWFFRQHDAPAPEQGLASTRHGPAFPGSDVTPRAVGPDMTPNGAPPSPSDHAQPDTAPPATGAATQAAAPTTQLSVDTSRPDGSTLSFALGPYTITPSRYLGRRVSVVRLPGADALNRRDHPALPCWRANLVIPEDSVPVVRVLDSDYEELACAPPIPATGFISRDPALRPGPQQFGAVYDGAEPYPAEVVRLTDPFMIRHVRGIGVIIHPFQYFPARGVLRAYRRLTIELATRGGGTERHALRFPRPFRSTEFAAAANRAFANAADAFRGTAEDDAGANGTGTPTRDGDPPETPEKLLIVVADALAANATLAVFAEWKRQRGIEVFTASYPTDTGSGSSSLATYINGQYQTRNITYVILVGDSGDIPVKATSPNPSDTLYTMVSGSDYYHDLLISRVSASTATTLDNQLSKILNYEKAPDTGNAAIWYSQGTMVGSNEGTTKSAFKLMDRELLDLERDKLMAPDLAGCRYTQIDRLYAVDSAYPGDPSTSPTAADVASAWNAGRGLIYYLGHGSETQWLTTGFSTSDAATLANGNALPFVANANCLNGKFTRSGGDCLAEAMMKAGTVASPAGAVGTIGSTTSMDWDPPTVMLQAFTGYLTETSPFTAGAISFLNPTPPVSAGGLTFFSIHRAMDYCYQTAGEGETAARKIAEQTHLFGDCTLVLRRTAPLVLDVTHAPAVVPGADFAVTVAAAGRGALANAIVCLYRSPDLQCIARTDANGQAAVAPGLIAGDELTLTVYHRDAVPYQAQVPLAGGELTVYSSATPPVAFTGEYYSFTHQAFGGTSPYAWAIASGGDTWLDIHANTGTVFGTPLEAGTVTYTAQVTDAEQATATQDVTITVGDAVSVTTAALAAGTVDSPFSDTVAATGSFPPFAFASVAGSLPLGLSLTADGILSGTPTVAGDYSFTVRATDAQSRTDDQALSLNILPSDTVTITTRPSLSDGVRGVAYAATLHANGGSGAGYTWTVTAGTLPPGLTLRANGSITGTPTLEGGYSFTLGVQDDWAPPHTAQQTFTLNIESAVYFRTTVLPCGAVGLAYDAEVPAAGSYPPFTYTEPSRDDYEQGAMPNAFTESGVLQDTWRTPTITDDREWTLNLGFAFPFYGTNYTSCKVGDNGYLVFGGTSPTPELWNANPQKFNTVKMIAPFWTDLVIAKGYPDTGIWVDSHADRVTVRWKGRDYHDVSGEADAGDPDHPIDYVNVAVTLHDTGRIEFHYGFVQTSNRIVVGICNGNSTQQHLVYWHTWNSSNPDYVQGWSERNDIPFTIARNLPEWLSLTGDGRLTGTPSAAGEYRFTVSVTDAHGYTASSELTLNVTLDVQPDVNGDGDVDNAEILAFIDLWADGLLTRTQVEAAIAEWRGGGSRAARSTRGEATAAQPLPDPPDLEDIYVLLVELPDRATLDWIIAAGFDIASRNGLTVKLYTPAAGLDQLRDRGLQPVIIDIQPPAPLQARGTRGAQPGYHAYADITAAVNDYAQNHPDICRVTSIGQSVQGRELWAVKITDNPDVDEDEPEVKYVATIHGDESLGTEMCLRFIEHLLVNYGGANGDGPRVTALVDDTEIWVVPCMNPDGLEANTRNNANNLDLNRAFPDGILQTVTPVFPGGTVDSSGRQPEVAAMMQWSAARSFVLSAGFHTGALLVCYPYGNNPQGTYIVDSPTPDDLLYEHLSRTYSLNNPDMAQNSPYPDGIINANAWYRVVGEMPDWNYRWLGTFETTVELSTISQPDAANIPTHWANNRESMLAYIEALDCGVRGVVTDALSGAPVWAEVTVAGNSHAMYTDAQVGDYHRPLLAGTYTLNFTAPGYVTQTVSDVVTGKRGAVRVDVQLERDTHFVQRQFGHVRYAPGEPNIVRLDMNIAAGAQPHALIVTETLPAGWIYQAGTTRGTGGTDMDEPRLDGDACSWLFWDTTVRDQTFSYRATAPAGNPGTATFHGLLDTAAEQFATGGVSAWLPLAANETLLRFRYGWNLFSVPTIPDNPSVPALLGTAVIRPVWGWSGNAFVKAETLATKQGYWGYATQETGVVYAGTPEPNPLRRFVRGWNLFGALADLRLTAERTLPGPAHYWDGNYQATLDLKSRLGYWIYSSVDQDVNLR